MGYSHDWLHFYIKVFFFGKKEFSLEKSSKRDIECIWVIWTIVLLSTVKIRFEKSVKLTSLRDGHFLHDSSCQPKITFYIFVKGSLSWYCQRAHTYHKCNIGRRHFEIQFQNQFLCVQKNYEVFLIAYSYLNLINIVLSALLFVIQQ